VLAHAEDGQECHGGISELLPPDEGLPVRVGAFNTREDLASDFHGDILDALQIGTVGDSAHNVYAGSLLSKITPLVPFWTGF